MCCVHSMAYISGEKNLTAGKERAKASFVHSGLSESTAISALMRSSSSAVGNSVFPRRTSVIRNAKALGH